MNTNMNKLGFKLVHVEGGTNEPLEVNASPEWVSKISENREDVGEVAKTSPNSRILFLKSIATGSLIGVARALTLTDRGLGCVIGWIYIPYDIIISGQEINSIVDFVSEHITSARIDGEAFRNAFSRPYAVLPEKGMFLGIEENSVKAFRYYGRGTRYTLTELLSKLKQPEYRRYNLVMLLDHESGVRVSGLDITNAPLVDVHVMTPPTETCGFTPYIAGQPFVKPIFVSSTEQVQVVLRKPGYKDIIRALSATDRLVVTPNDTMRVVEAGSIKVWDEATRRPVENCVVSLNGQPLPVYVSDSDRRQVAIKVDAPGYHTYRGTYDLDRSNGILLKKAERTYIFQLRLKNGKNCRFSIPTMDEFYEVPINGYTSDRPVREGIVNYLEYKPSNGGWLRAIIVGAAALIVGICLGLGISALTNGNSSKKEQTEQTQNKKNQGKGGNTGTTKNNGKTAGAGNDTSKSGKKELDPAELAKAVDYLDKHQPWQKDEMEEFEALKGLHGYLCSYNIDKILEFKSTLADSDSFMIIVKAIEYAKNKNFTLEGRYDGETGITVEKYKNVIDKKCLANQKPDNNQSSGQGSNQKKPDKTSSTTNNAPGSDKGDQPDASKGNDEAAKAFK